MSVGVVLELLMVVVIMVKTTIKLVVVIVVYDDYGSVANCSSLVLTSLHIGCKASTGQLKDPNNQTKNYLAALL